MKTRHIQYFVFFLLFGVDVLARDYSSGTVSATSIQIIDDTIVQDLEQINGTQPAVPFDLQATAEQSDASANASSSVIFGDGWGRVTVSGAATTTIANTNDTAISNADAYLWRNLPTTPTVLSVSVRGYADSEGTSQGSYRLSIKDGGTYSLETYQWNGSSTVAPSRRDDSFYVEVPIPTSGPQGEFGFSVQSGNQSSAGSMTGSTSFQLIADLVWGTGSTQSEPITMDAAESTEPMFTPDIGEAVTIGDGAIFANRPSGAWYDSTVSYGSYFEMRSESLFTQVIDFGTVADQSVEVWAEGQLLGSYTTDDTLSFVDLLGHGVESFSLSGIDSMNGSASLPLKLAFDTPTADFAQYSLITHIDGDYNGDGFVSQADLDLVLLNWGDTTAPTGFDENALPGGGPFDNLVSQNELDGVLLNWGNGTTPAGSAPGSFNAIPEPTSLALLSLTGLALRRRRSA